jgi:hypothetical protein
MKASRLQIPDASEVPDGINCTQVLSTWDNQKIKALLSRPIFDEAIYGTARFHHRMVREYLTALWLVDLLKDGKSRRAIEGLFIQVQYGQTVLVPSLRPVLAWMILFDERLREQTLSIAPEVALQGGDPTEWPFETRAMLLRKFCSHYSDDAKNHLSFDIADVRRFSHTDLGPTIHELLRTHVDNADIRLLLLRMVWQAEIALCIDLCCLFAQNKNFDPYTRLLAIRAIGAAGTEIQINQIISYFVTSSFERDDRVISELFETLLPRQLSTSDALLLLERGTEEEKTSHRHIGYALDQYIGRCSPDELYGLIVGFKKLVDVPPYVERKLFEVSQQFSWLLKHAALACKALIELKHNYTFRTEVLAIISVSQAASSFLDNDTKDVDLGKVVRVWPYLNHALFWHDVAYHRLRVMEKGESLVEWWQARSFDRYWQFESKDFSRVVDEIGLRELDDDKCVALSLAFQLFYDSGRSTDSRKLLNNAVRGNARLEGLLSSKLKPPKQNDSMREFKRTESKYKQQQKQREIREAENHLKSKQAIVSNLQFVNNTQYASTGAITQHQAYLFHWLRKHESNRMRWALNKYDAIITEFGQDVANAFRDGAIAYWKEYQPRLRSHGLENPNSVPWGVIFGLTGIEFEVRHESDWVAHLTADLATKASQYALLEMNGLPEWLQDIHQKFPQEVQKVVLDEIRWEIFEYAEEQECSYVLSDVTWHGNWLKPELSEQVFMLLEECAPKHVATLKQSLAIVLAGENIDAFKIAALVRKNLDREKSLPHRAVWFAASLAASGAPAIETLEEELSKLQPSEATELAIAFLNALLGDRHETLSSIRSEYSTPSCLHQLYELLLKHIRPSEDIERAGTGVFSPGPRDDAQTARSQLFKMLLGIPGKETFLALKSLAKSWPDRPWYESYAKDHAEKDSEKLPWTVDDLAAFASETERTPKDHKSLFGLISSRLNDLKSHFEQSDDSTANIVIKTKDETEIRNYVGNWLRDKSQNRYSVPQEEELADAKRPDIRIHGNGFDAPVPIELKIADNNWSGRKLFERLQNQLCGDYLRDQRSTCGVYLLFNRGEKQTWSSNDGQAQLNFAELVTSLQKFADGIVAQRRDIEDVIVVGIDLTIRMRPQICG